MNKDIINDLKKYGIHPGLETIKNLLGSLDIPLDGKKIIHIAGTDAKGSVGEYISKILEGSGKKTGHFLSPAVFEYEEMFRINGKNISEKRLEDIYSYIEKIRKEKGSLLPHPTLFEMETAAALLYFHEEDCDYMVIECGMGGKWDATNVFENTKMCVFTPIGRDHEKFLGDSLEKIASNKAGIIKEGAICISAHQEDPVRKILLEKNNETKFIDPLEISKGVSYENGYQIFSYRDFPGLRTKMLGAFQRENAALAIEAARSLIGDKKDFGGIVYKAVEKAALAGRFDIRRTYNDIPLVLDGAHNPPAVRRLLGSLEEYFPHEEYIFILGVFMDKNIKEIARLISKKARRIITITPPSERGFKGEDLRDICLGFMGNAEYAGSVDSAIDKALEGAGDNSCIICTGSFSYLKDVRQ